MHVNRCMWLLWGLHGGVPCTDGLLQPYSRWSRIISSVSMSNNPALYGVYLAAMTVNALSLRTLAGLPRRCAFCKLFRAYFYDLPRPTPALTGSEWSTMQPMICRMLGACRLGIQARHRAAGRQPGLLTAAVLLLMGMPEERGALGLKACCLI